MKMDKMEKFFVSNKLRKVVGILLALGIILFIFEAGVLVGYKSAFFSSHLGDNYYKNFEGREPGEEVLSNFNPANLPSANGATGLILKISLPSIIVADKDGIEKTITVTDDTIFRQFRGNITATDLKVGDFIVVVGSPDDTGAIVAGLVRVLPPPPQMRHGTSTPSQTASGTITN